MSIIFFFSPADAVADSAADSAADADAAPAAVINVSLHDKICSVAVGKRDVGSEVDA